MFFVRTSFRAPRHERYAEVSGDALVARRHRRTPAPRFISKTERYRVSFENPGEVALYTADMQRVYRVVQYVKQGPDGGINEVVLTSLMSPHSNKPRKIGTFATMNEAFKHADERGATRGHPIIPRDSK